MEIFTKAFGFIRKNKWMVSFIATAVALVAAVTVAIVIGVNANKPETPPEYYLGAEAGTYYYDVEGGETLLTLSENKTFTLTGPQLNKTGTYTIDAEGNMVIDFVRDEDGTTTATVSGTSLRLVYNEATMTFTKKVNYTVTFNVNGGTAINNATVVNGKTVAEPAEPTKEGHAFLGWYTDASYTTKFNFNTTSITADTTIVAKWVAINVGSGVYDVSFDLGYEGAPEYDSISTINGNVYDAPVPVREGYTFAGWYVSMYNDAEKLSYAFSEQTVFTADTTLFAVWQANTDAAIAAPQVSVTGSVISWPNVSGATSYNITVANAAGEKVVEKTIGTTSEAVDFSKLAAGDYVITVTAVGAGATSEATTRYFANKVLDRVSGITVVDGILVYSPVANATKYTLTIDCANANHNHGAFDNGNRTTYNLTSCGMKQGGIKITVTASADGYANSVAEYVYERNLAAIDAVVYNAATDSFVWNAVANATSYTVTLTVGEETYTFTVNNTSFSVAAYTGEIAVTVVPVTAGFNSPAATAASYSKIVPATPDGLTVLGDIVSWNPAAGAESYEIKIGDKTFPVAGTSVDLTTLIDLVSKSIYDIQVKAVNGAESSAYSATLSVGYLVMNPTLSYAGGKVSWVPVLGTNTFNVRVNGGEIITVTDATSAAVKFDRAGSNVIEVRCVDGRKFSEWVQLTVVAYEVIYMPRNLEGERSEYVAVGDPLSLPTDYTLAGYDFDAWYTAPDKHGVQHSGTFEGDGALALFAGWNPKTYTVNLVNDDEKVEGLEEGATASVIFNSKDFYITPPTYTDPAYAFVGWFTGPNATGDQYTDENGYGIVKYADATGTTILYPGFLQVMKTTLQPDGTYAVSKGPNIGKVSKLVIPETYNGKPVTVILENGFVSSKKLVEVSIPNSIKLVGAGAFDGCTALTAINVREVEGDHEAAYRSDNGALIREVSGQTYLEMFPRAKTGHYTIPEGVTQIRNRAFTRSQISGITIASTITNVPDYAFYYCQNLEVVSFEEGREFPVSLSAESFYNCASVVEFNVPADIVGEVDDIVALFKAMPELLEINVADGGEDAAYTSIDGILVGKDNGILYVYPAAKKFRGEFTVPAGVTDIYTGAFAGSAITELVVPTYVQSIGERAFAGSKLTKVTFAANRNGALEIAAEAFAECGYLTSVVFEENTRGAVDAGAVTIGERAFAPSTSMNPRLATVTFGAGVNVAEIGESAFAGQTSLTKLNCAETAVITAIGARAFEKCEKLTEILLSGGTTSIGDYAYSGCKAVTKVVFLPGSDEINFGSYVFNNCVKLLEVNLPATLTQFDASAFNGCDSLRKVTVEEGNLYYKNDVNGILYNADETELIFYPKDYIREQGFVITIKDGVTTIGASVFNSAQGLKEVKLPATLATIGASAFADCLALEKVEFAAGTAALTIGDGAFEGCTALTDEKFEIPARTVAIGDRAFKGCNFVAREIPAGVTVIGAEAFAKNTALTTVTIPASVTAIGNGAFASCYELDTVNLPEAATLTLGDDFAEEENGVFYNCTKLTSVTIPVGTTSIGAYAFVNSAITSIKIPNTVTNIGNHAFAAKTEALIQTITFEPGNTAALYIGEYAFEGQKLVTSIELPYRTAKLGGTKTYNETEYATAYTVFNGMSALESITFQPEVAGVTATYTAKVGVLYADGGATLLYCPVNNAGVDGELVIGKEVTLVANAALRDLARITTVTFENYAEDHENYGKPLLSIGALNMAVPGGEENEIIALPEELRVIGGTYTNSITKIDLPSHLGRLNSGALAATANDVDVTFNENSTVALSPLAFAGSHAKEINIPKASEIGTFAFASILSATSFKIAAITSDVTRTPAYMISFNVNVSLGDYGFNNSGDVLYAPADSNAFKNGKLEYVYIPDGITELGDDTFLNAYNLKTVEFGDASKIKTLGYTLFGNNNALESFPFNEFTGLESVGNLAFRNLTKLSAADLSACVSLKNLGLWMFDGCKQLRTLILPPNIESIGGGEIVKGTGITHITFSKGFTAEMLEAPFFSDNREIEFVSVDPENPYLCSDEFGAIYDKNKTILYYLPAKINLKDYTIPSTVKAIGKYAFKYVDFVDIVGQFVIPEGVESIDDYAFTEIAYSSTEGTGFDLVLPASLKRIGNQAFYSATREATVNGVKQLAGIINVIITDTKETPSQLTEIGDQAFASCSLRTINIPDSVTAIGVSAFESSAITEVILPAGITEIPENCFNKATSLASVTIQGNVDVIGVSAFMSCSKLANVTIPASVTEICQSAFNQTTNLATVTFEDGSWLTTIGDMAFYSSALSSINLPDSLRTIGVQSFAVWDSTGASKLTSIDLSNTLVTEIPEKAFQGATALETVKLPEALTSIGVGAFAGYSGKTSNLKEIELPATLISIGENAFQYSALTSITIPYSVETIGASAFADATSLVTVTFEEGSAITELGEYGNATNIFKGTTALETVTIPNELQLIGDNAFENSGIKNIVLANPTLPSDLVKIGSYAFSGCTRLEKFDLMGGLTHIAEYAFAGSGLKEVVPALGLEYFGEMAFSNCAGITKGYIPETVIQLTGNPYTGCPLTEIVIDKNPNIAYSDDGILYDTAGYSVLIAMNAVGDITLPETVRVIAAGAFVGSKVEKIKIPGSVKEIPLETFKNVTTLKTLELGEGITTIGNEAFAGCTSLESVKIPASVTTIGNSVFAGCTGLVHASFVPKDLLDSNVTCTIGEKMFSGCSSLVDCALPNKSKDGKLPAYMFEGTAIVNAVIPACFTNIGNAGVFKNCKELVSIDFEADAMTYTTIGGYLFYGCSKLESVTIPYSASATAPLYTTSKAGHVFEDCTSLKFVSVHIKTYSRYKKAMVIGKGQQASVTGEDSPNMFTNCTSLEEVKIYFGTPDAMTEGFMIPGTKCFMNCVSLKSAPLGDYAYIYADAFSGAGVSDIIIDKPYNLAQNAFRGYTGNIYFTNLAGYQITYSGKTTTQYPKFGYKSKTVSYSIFDGWTEDQNIYFLNNTEAEVADLLAQNYCKKWKDGCKANIYYADTLATVTELELKDFDAEFWTPANLGLFTGATTLKVGKVHGELAANLFEGTAFTTVSFTDYTHAQLSEMLKGGALTGCTATVLDKDGNKLVYDATAKTLTVYGTDETVVETYNYSA